MPTMTTTETRRARPLVLGASVLALGLILFFGIRVLTREAVQIRVSPVTHENLISTVSTSGKVEPVLDFQPHAPSAGVIQKIYVQAGQKVKAGALLIQMTDVDAAARVAATTSFLRGAESTYTDERQGGSKQEQITGENDINQARIQQQQAAGFLESIRRLQEKGAASASEVISAENRLAATNATLKLAEDRAEHRVSPMELRRAQAQVADGQASVASAEAAYNNANVRAPFAGTVYSIPVNQYDFVSGGEPLLDLADLDHFQIRAYFDEPEIGKLAKGQAVKILWDAKQNQTWHGHIERAPTTVFTQGTRSVGECLITVDGEHSDLLPNTNVTVIVTTSQRFNVLSVPREALHSEGLNDYVYRVVKNRLVRTSVQVGITNLTRVEILSGLNENDTVALGATSNRDLTSGLEVTPVE